MKPLQCIAADYQWEVEPDSLALEGTNNANLFVRSGLVPGVQYKFSVNVTLNGTTQREAVVVDAMPLKPIGYIAGGSRPVPWNKTLRVEYVKTFDETLLVRNGFLVLYLC